MSSRSFPLLLAACVAIFTSCATVNESVIDADLDKLLADAVKNGRSSLTLSRGIYRIDHTWKLSKLRNFTIDGNGATLVFTRPVIALGIYNCENLIVRNLTIDYDPLPFSQGTVLANNPAKREIRVRIHAGYPRPKPHIKIFVFDKETRHWKRGLPEYYGVNSTPLATPGEFLLSNISSKRIEPGDLVVFARHGLPAINVIGNRSIQLDKVKIFTSTGAGIIGRLNSGKDRYEGLIIGPGPTPEGATESRLVSTLADGFNYAYCEQGPDLIGADISRQGDDGVNFHSVMFAVAEQRSPTQLVIIRPNVGDFSAVVKPGMDVRVLKSGNFAVLDKAVIEGFEKLPSFTIPQKRIRALFPTASKNRKVSTTAYLVTLRKPVKIQPGAFLDIPSICSGFTIRDCYFHDHRARGIRMMCSDGLIENNRFERIKQNAITIGGEYGFWREAGYVDNLSIRNNRIYDVGTGYYMMAPTSYAPGAIALITRPERGVKEIAPGNRNLVIEDNVIDGCPGAGIVLHAVDGATVRRNRIVNVLNGDYKDAGKKYGFSIRNPIQRTPSAINVKMEDNRFE